MRRDHDDIDRGFSALIAPSTPIKELTNLVEIVRLALAVHAAAEAKILARLVAHAETPRTLSGIVRQARLEHIEQLAATDALLKSPAGSIDWYEHAIELRTVVLEHALRVDLLRWTLFEHVPPALQDTLGSQYATERMRVLASTSPLAIAEQREPSIAVN